jgi:hypothetical protein
MNTLSYYAKCITAAIVTGYGTYQVAMADGVITQGEWVQIVLAVLASLSVVWGVPNTTTKVPLVAPQGPVLPVVAADTVVVSLVPSVPATTPLVTPVTTSEVVTAPFVARLPHLDPVAAPLLNAPPVPVPVDLSASVQAGS